MLATIFSSLIFLAAPAAIPEPPKESLCAICTEVIRQRHLDTTEGKLSFLSNELISYTLAAEELNKEISVLSEQIRLLSAEEDRDEIAALSAQLTEKMELMSWMLPSLEFATHVDSDLSQIDAILNSPDPTPEEKDAANRIVMLCLYIDLFNRKLSCGTN